MPDPMDAVDAVDSAADWTVDDDEPEPTPACRSLLKLSDDFETDEAREEAARIINNFSSIALLALADGTSPVQARRRLLRFVAGVPLPQPAGAALVKVPKYKSGPPCVYLSNEPVGPVIARIRRPTGGG